MIIDNSYFQTKPLFIPNAVAQPAIGYNTPDNTAELNLFIDEKERELLLSFLGYDQLTELLSQFTDDGDWKSDALQKWKDLVDGKNDWKGLRYEVSGKKYSLIAYYVYFYFLGEDATYYSGTGVQAPEAANSESVLPNPKQVKAWNMFVRMYGSNVSYNRPTFFNNWNGTGMTWLGNNPDANSITLYDFMTKNSDVYNTSFFRAYTPLNNYGL